MRNLAGAVSPEEPDDPPIISLPVRFWRGFGGDMKEMFLQRDLLRAFIFREFRIRYKGARLGWVWALAKPLVMLFIYALAVGVFLGAGKAVPQFAIYLFVGLIAWGLFAQIVIGSITALVLNADLIRKAAFPRELLIVAVIATALFDFLIQGLVLTFGYFFYGSWPAWQNLWWVVPALILTVLFGAAFGLLLSAANASLRDVGFLTEVAMQVAFWLVPVIYAYSAVKTAFTNYPFLDWLYLANPVTIALFGFRNALWPPAMSSEGDSFGLQSGLGRHFVILTLAGIAFAFASQRFFAIRAANMAQDL